MYFHSIFYCLLIDILICCYHSNFTQRKAASLVLNISSFYHGEAYGRGTDPSVEIVWGQHSGSCPSNIAADPGIKGGQVEMCSALLT